MKIFREFNFKKRLLVVLVLFSVMTSAFYLATKKFSGSAREDNAGEFILGEVTSSSNDVRYKSRASFEWQNSGAKQRVGIGDSLFSGKKSHAEVKLSKGGDVSVGENSLVVFNEIENENVADLMQGNFRLNIRGKARVAIQGKITTLEGDNSDVQIFTDKNRKPKLKVISGSVKVAFNNSTRMTEIDPHRTVEIPVNSFSSEVSSPPEQRVTVEVPRPVSAAEVFLYSWKVDDLYEILPGRQARRKSAAAPIPLEIPLQWQVSRGLKPGESYFLNIAKDPSFQNSKIFKLSENHFKFSNLKAGRYYWRVSKDQVNWSAVQKFGIAADFTAEEPQARVPLNNYFPHGSAALVSFSTDNPRAAGMVVAISSSREFAKEDTYLKKFDSRSAKISFSRAGIYYARIQNVNSQAELSRWSAPIRFGVVEQKMKSKEPESPRIQMARPAPPKTERKERFYERKAASEENAAPPETASTRTQIEEREDKKQKGGAEMWAWLGGGTSFTSVGQDVPGGSKVEVGGIKIPAYLFRGGFWMTPSWGLNFDYKRTPGKVLPSENFTVHNGNFEWQTLSAEGRFRLSSPELPSLWSIRAGVQHHQVPFFVPIDVGEIEVVQSGLLDVSLGIEHSRRLTNRTRIETSVGYQHPFKNFAPAGSTFSVSKSLSFDGYLGAVYEMSRQTRFGIYWGGQYHSYAFDYASRLTETHFAGKQNLFYSTVDFRLGLEF